MGVRRKIGWVREVGGGGELSGAGLLIAVVKVCIADVGCFVLRQVLWEDSKSTNVPCLLWVKQLRAKPKALM